jgi:hypothetical protein
MYQALGQALPAQSLRPSFPAESRSLAESGFLQEGHHAARNHHMMPHLFAAKGGDHTGHESTRGTGPRNGTMTRKDGGLA